MGSGKDPSQSNKVFAAAIAVTFSLLVPLLKGVCPLSKVSFNFRTSFLSKGDVNKSSSFKAFDAKNRRHSWNTIGGTPEEASSCRKATFFSAYHYHVHGYTSKYLFPKVRYQLEKTESESHTIPNREGISPFKTSHNPNPSLEVSTVGQIVISAIYRLMHVIFILKLTFPRTNDYYMYQQLHSFPVTL